MCFCSVAPAALCSKLLFLCLVAKIPWLKVIFCTPNCDGPRGMAVQKMLAEEELVAEGQGAVDTEIDFWLWFHSRESSFGRPGGSVG